MKLQLFGDSISLGYTPGIRETLEPQGWEVAGVPMGTSAAFLELLREGRGDRAADIVHFNCGLHDLVWEPDQKAHRVEPEAYGQNLAAALDLLQAEFSGRLIWATLTPVLDGVENAAGVPLRCDADVDRYNAVALLLMQARGIAVDDLHGLVVSHGKERIIDPDGPHFLEEGSRLLAAAVVASVLCRQS